MMNFEVKPRELLFSTKTNWTMMNFEVKPRELLFSTIIVSLMVGIGVWLQNIILKSSYEEMSKVASSVKISSPDEFSYAKRTNLGGFVAEGTIVPIHPVAMPDIPGEYTIIEKVKERYTVHTRIVYHRVNGHTVSHTQTYHTWDVVDRNRIESDSLVFLDQVFLMDSIKFKVKVECDTTIYESRTVRYKYYVCPDSLNGAMTGKCENKSFSEIEFRERESIESIIKSAENKASLRKVLFWVLWIGMTGVMVFLFCYAENDWLEDRNKR